MRCSLQPAMTVTAGSRRTVLLRTLAQSPAYQVAQSVFRVVQGTLTHVRFLLAVRTGLFEMWTRGELDCRCFVGVKARAAAALAPPRVARAARE